MDVIEVLRELGYRDEDLFRGVEISHPLLKGTVRVDAALKHQNGYGLVVMYGELKDEKIVELCGICAIVGARYGILTDGKERVVIRPRGGMSWDVVEDIPTRYELEEELGIKRHLIIAISYDEYEDKVDDIGFVVDNSRYVYSDMDRDEVVIIHPNAKLIGWLVKKNVRFREFGDDDYLRLYLD